MSHEPSRYVSISPPLEGQVRVLGGPPLSARVHGLGVNHLALEVMTDQTSPGEANGVSGMGAHHEMGLGDLTVRWTGDRLYAFRCYLTSTDRGLMMASPARDEDRARLTDLLGLVRKGQHITLCATADVEASDRYTGFSDVVLRPVALPEMSWDQVDTRVSFLGRPSPLPLLITGMTGGLAQGAEINRRLGRAAAHYGIPMGVGSQRIALENPEHAAIFDVKTQAPGVFLIGNLGMAQLRRKDALDLCRRAVDMIDADALAIHVNVLQEVVQIEGDRNFEGILDHIAHIAQRLEVPVMIKEVGCGMDVATALRLKEAGVSAIDCGGKGGTSWSLIEGLRADSRVTQDVGATFRDWGIPTAVSVAAVTRALPDLPIVATGGIRDGLTVAKAAALGATLCGIGLPLLKAAMAGEDEPFLELEKLAQGLKTAMICSGARHLQDLAPRLAWRPGFAEAMALYGPNKTSQA